MQHSKGPDSPEMGRTVSRSRSTSISSDSQIPRAHLLAPTEVTPAPTFIASSAAAQIITTDQEFNAADFVADEDGPGSNASALVTREALATLNRFLDYLLFNILATAKSTQLACIRPAVVEVLKPRLAKEVVEAADDELSEFMGGPEDEQIEFRGGQTPGGDFDLIHSWKLTRLRCMVYTRLGDMEEDEEEEHIARESLADEDGVPRRLASHVGNITPAAAIFLTSIIEHLGEQALIIAGEIARSRLSTKLEQDSDESTEAGVNRASMDRLVVEDHDMEKLALNPTLGRLWRTWRKRVRGSNPSRAVSRESMRRRHSVFTTTGSRKSNVFTADDFSVRSATSPLPQTPKDIDPTLIPLPLNDHDVQEIEVPGYLPELETGEIQTMQAVVAHKVRPHSLMVLTLPSPRLPSSSVNSPLTPKLQTVKITRHARSRSLPNAGSEEETPEPEQYPERPSPTASEERRRLETMYEHDEDDERDGNQGEKAEKIQFANQMNQEAEAMQEATTTAVAHEVATPVSPTSPIETELLEGQGVRPRPRLASAQRPRPRTMREPSIHEEGSPPVTPVVDEQAGSTVSEDAPQTQGADSASVAPAVDLDELSCGESVAPPTTRSSTDDGNSYRASRPISTSGESTLSDVSRKLPRSSPLSNGAHHRYGRSSPGISSVKSGIERAAVQRLSGRPSTSVASSSYSKPRRSDSFGSSRERRPVTSGSSASSKLKGLIVRTGDSNSLRLRNSSEISRVSTRESAFDDTTGLDDLIRSEETLHFTLTPRNMREMELPDSPRWRAQQTIPSDSETGRPRTSHASSKSIMELAPMSKCKSSEQPKYTPIVVPDVLPPQPPMDQTVASPTSIISSESGTPTIAVFDKSGPVKPSSVRRVSDATDVSRKFNRPGSASTRTSGSRLQARPAVASQGDQTSDLIDFIREGPPTAGAHRISRAVAPFRDTMDSDELQALESGRPSMQGSLNANTLTSVGSRTGLLETGNRASTPTTYSKEISEDTRPKRKQRRVRDPYAIDSDDDDLDELLEAPKPKREEESLIDFLRNVPPPAAASPLQPLATNMGARRGSSAGFAGASSVKTLLSRNQATEKNVLSKPSRGDLRQASDSTMTGANNNYTTRTMSSGYGLPSVSQRQTETSALADFLRNTGPPEPPVVRPTQTPPPTKSKESGFSRLFTRRKKIEV
ncbi:uncharacterized protein BP01DRAFT_236339 [Aspergillus saccharolyticus JOP 1030-1]|uniref:Uncharacterized protein n=1 Tax=Aspergillus saccharolyticus JOP 1030-1 TaxID=1450539 RepID=A0A318ZS33_9EURO|nr:hypothetical protein BP01DRAFT_236339 [Aspergillus saccharolyticus JOP 1030-1]PYH46760.1 hypothetical protein BP01DRAFT_236339 [Aspergillus saccharolyticus JOP 1030-1]